MSREHDQFRRSSARDAETRIRMHEQEEDEEDEDEDYQASVDRIRRSYHIHEQASNSNRNRMASNQAETIQVTLNEGYFAKEKQVLLGLLANARQKLSSIQMFNPAQNEDLKRKQEDWNEKEKYTLDSLNELKATDEKFQWSKPEDGREVWPSKTQYFLAITSYSIGFGNVIRFPILVQKNGGLAFLIPFVIMLLLEGIPLFYLELAIGQRMRKASISCWNLISPFAAGIGLASAAVSFSIGLYYNTMVAWSLMYSWSSILAKLQKSPLPFTVCPTEEDPAQEESSESSGNFTSPQEECNTIGSYNFYWFRRTLDISSDVNNFDSFNWHMAVCLIFAWLISYVCLVKGLSSSKRIVYVSSTLPYVILSIFFFKAISLEGMSDGIYYFIAPDWPKLFDPYVWLQAAAQVFFSLGLGFGGLIALSSYNPINNNCYKDAVKVSIINFATSIFAGVVLFAILGFRANLKFEQCQIERDQQINFYLSDYNLKVLAYKDVFFEQKSQAENEVRDFVAERRGDTSSGMKSTSQKLIDEYIKETNDENRNNNNKAINPDYDLEDALLSIKNLDYQLNKSSENDKMANGESEGDSDTEFILDTSTLISPNDFDKIISNIENLNQCSLEKELDESTKGMGFVFVVLADAISQFDTKGNRSMFCSTTWAIIFFLMLLALGLDSQFGNLEGLISSILDLDCLIHLNRQIVTGIICTLSLLLSLLAFAHGSGSYMFALFDEFVSNFSLVLIALVELMAISYIYGLKRFHDDCELMTGKRPNFIILLSWRYISPILLLVVILATSKQFSTELVYEAWRGDHLESVDWPDWCIILGSLMIVCCTIWIPLVMILNSFKLNLLPKEEVNRRWFPADELREFHGLQDEGTRQFTRLERVLFGFTNDED